VECPDGLVRGELLQQFGSEPEEAMREGFKFINLKMQS